MIMLLRAVHIVAGLFWVGGVIVVSMFLVPAGRAAGASGQQLLADVMIRRRLATYIPLSAVLTFLAGLALFYRNEVASRGVWSRSPMGTGISVGAAAAVLAAVFGMGVAGPAMKKLARASAGQSSGGAPLAADEIAKLQRRVDIGTRAAVLLLLIASVAMAVARYR